jgi:hypothetical protein
MNPDRTTTKTMTITTHTNTNGIEFYSTTDEDGKTIYSFSREFEDIWTQEDEDEITTTNPIADAVAHLDPESVLCDLPDELFEPGRAVSDAVRAAGYDESATTVINNLHAWRMTVADFIELISGNEDED